MKFIFDNKKNSKGFTLIELIVVSSVFLLVSGTAIGIFISVIENQRRLLLEQEVIAQTGFTMEYMSKALRMAKKDLTGDCLGTEFVNYNYLLTEPDSSTGKYRGIKFINQSDSDACTEFYVDAIDPGNLVLYESKNNKDPVNFLSSNIKINSAEFKINAGDNLIASLQGSPGDDGIQPRVTMFLDISIGQGQNIIRKQIQTTVSQRDINQ